MGNSQTKEARLPSSPSRTRVNAQAPGSPRPEPIRDSEPTHIPAYAPRNRRGSRPDLSFLGIGGNGDQDVASLEARRESKQEREARKLEKEKTARLKEREQSMKEEHVDGGYLVTQGVYVGPEDYNKSIVRQLMIERMLAPFWKGLNDFSESWAEHQLMAAARGLPIPPADQVPPELEYQMSPKTTADDRRMPDRGLKLLTVPINSRAQSFNSEASSNPSPSHPTFSLPSPSSPLASNSPNTPLFRTRAKTLASLTTSSRNNSQSDMTPRELQLPKDPFVNGQPIEVYLYKDASECPICFLYYPPYLNTTRCCDQAICSECFVQIKRPDPHPPEHEQPDPNAPPLTPAEREAQSDGQLVSEVATCPFCKQPEFGITYVPPPFRRGLTYSTAPQPYQVKSAMSSQTSVVSGTSGNGRRRGTSISANAPEVVTTDKIRPDWASKLATARAHAARRSAAATALHTAAYLMNGTADNRPFSLGRRRRPTLEGLDMGSSTAHMNALALLAERHAARQQEAENGTPSLPSNPFLPPPRGSSTRRSRMEDLEDMMLMEAIRLSLASEEDRRKKEEKEAKKEAKKKEKEAKKAEKAAKKSGLYAMNSNASYGDPGESAATGRTGSIASSIASEDGAFAAKGKGVDRIGSSPIAIGSANDHSGPTASTSVHGRSPSGTSQESLPLHFPSLPQEPVRRSHLRHMSNVSSSASSLVESGSAAAFAGTNTPPGGGAGIEPMFNFRSLAAMIGNEEKGDGVSHIDHQDSAGRTNLLDGDDESAAEASSSPLADNPEKGRQEGHDPTKGGAEEIRGSLNSQVSAGRDASDS